MDIRANDTCRPGGPAIGHAPPAVAARLEELADTITDDVADLLYVVAQDLAESGPHPGGPDDGRHHLGRATALLRDVAGDLRTIASWYPDPPR